MNGLHLCSPPDDACDAHAVLHHLEPLNKTLQKPWQEQGVHTVRNDLMPLASSMVFFSSLRFSLHIVEHRLLI